MTGIMRVFQGSVLGLTALSAFMLSMAEGAAFPAMLSLPLAVIAFFVTERTPKLALNTIWVNIGGLLAFIVAGIEFSAHSLEARFLALAHLLVYLSWVLFFQRKKMSHYWWLCALAVLQVAIGSVLTKDGMYGIAMVLFVFASIWTLSIFSLCQARLRITDLSELPQYAGLATAPAGTNIDPTPDVSSVLSSTVDTTAGRPTRMDSFLQGGTARGTVHRNTGELWIGKRFVVGIIATTVLSLFLAAAFFALIPRHWIGERAWLEGALNNSLSMTGFANEIRLGDMGRILESTEKVFDVRMERIYSDGAVEPLDIATHSLLFSGRDTEPLFRGRTLAHYQDGGWTALAEYDSIPFKLPSPISTNSIVRQEYRLRERTGDVLVAVSPAAGCVIGEMPSRTDRSEPNSFADSPVYARYYPEPNDILRPRGYRDREVPYSVYSPSDPYDAVARALLVDDSRRMFPYRRRQYLRLPRVGLSRLAALAREVSHFDAPEGRPDDATMATSLKDHLRSGIYGYTLDAKVIDPTIDPVEDFLFNRQQGHCEYFASALTLMLRSVDIPARLISGFKGGVLNRFTGRFEVEQRHAHAWVEAYYDGRWNTLDPTPGAIRSESVDSFGSDFQAWRNLRSLFAGLWDRYVLTMNLDRQRSEIFSPIKDTVTGWWNEARGGRLTFSRLWNAIRDTLSSPKKWLSWHAWVTTFLLLLALAGLVKLARITMRFVPRMRTMWRTHQAARPVHVEFYERFRKLCRTHGLDREAAQTDREFADDVEGRFGEPLARAGLLQVPAELVDCFYRIRFGRQPLDPATMERMDGLLTRLETAMANTNGNAQCG